MSSEIKTIDLQKKLYSIKANNPFEDFSYLRAMEQSNSASEKSGWIPDHLGEIKNKKLIYNYSADQRTRNKFENNETLGILETGKLPKYIQKNLEIFGDWLVK